jgi:hypothetical protein
LSHEIPAKKKNTIFCYRAWQRDRPANFAAVARDNPAKNKYDSRVVFFVVALGKISSDVTVTLHLRGTLCDQRASVCPSQIYMHSHACNVFMYVRQFLLRANEVMPVDQFVEPLLTR